MMKRCNPTDVLRVPLVALLLSVLLCLSGCGSDEPDYVIGYYLSIDSQVQLSLTDKNEQQGSMPDMGLDVLSNAVRRMRDTLQVVYPHDTRQGDDIVVLSALEDIYTKYKAAYSDMEDHTVCIVKLYRVKKDGEVARESTTLRTFYFGALPVDVVPIDY